MTVAKPIIMQSWGVRATMKGKKTQTRRIIKPQPSNMDDKLRRSYVESDALWKYPVGSMLWVRETWAPFPDDPPWRAEYKADGEIGEDGQHVPMWSKRWRPSIHMPRWASRLTLRITDVRVQRLQEITEEDAIAEGCEYKPGMTCRNVFAALWDSINGKRATWSSNPWVYAISYEIVK